MLNNKKIQRTKKNGSRKATAAAAASVKAPMSIAKAMKGSNPTFSKEKAGSVSLSHREFIGDVPGSVGFAVSQYSINPGLFGTFPWLSKIAGRYEQYKFESIRFEFVSSKPSTAAGRVTLAYDYDASDSAPTTKQQILSYRDFSTDSIWKSSSCSGRPVNLYRYVRLGALAANSDIKTFDLGNLFVATEGCADTSNIGELYVHYSVSLIEAQSDLAAERTAETLYITPTAGVSRAAPFGTARTYSGGLLITAANARLTFSQTGSFLLTDYHQGTVFTDVLATLTPSGAEVVVAPFAGPQMHSTAATQATGIWRVTVTSPGYIDFDFTAAATTVTTTSFLITTCQY